MKPFVDEEEVKVVSLNPLVVLLPYSDWVWSTWIPCGFSTLKYLVSLCVFCVLSVVFLSMHYLACFSLHPNTYTKNRLLSVPVLTSGIRAMDEHLGGMFKLTGSNYSVWKSKMRDMLMCKDLWLPVQYDETKTDKIDASTWEVIHMKAATYIRCFIDMSLYNNFDEKNKANALWEKICIMLENKNVVDRVSVFRKIVRLPYQDDSSMAEHINAF